MQIIRNLSDAQQIAHPEIRALALQRIRELSDQGFALEEVGRIAVLDATDTVATIEQQLGVSISAYELVEDHPWCIELLYVLDQAGVGSVVFAPTEEGIDPDLLALLKSYAVKGTP